MGTAAQFITGYPVIALVGLNIARRRLDRQGFWGKPAPVSSYALLDNDPQKLFLPKS